MPQKKKPQRNEPQEASGPPVIIESEQVIFNFKTSFKIILAEIQYLMSSGVFSPMVTRLCFERGDSVGVLLHDSEQDNVILVRQFRYPAYVRLREEEAQSGRKTGWLLEIAAGIVEEGDDTSASVARRELLEEAGYHIQGNPKHITTVFASPGGSSERIHIFLAEVDPTKMPESGGGLIEEGEDTEVVVVSAERAIEMITSGEIQDAKTILALQHLQLLRMQ